MNLNINGTSYQVADDDLNRPLLWVLRDELGLSGTKFGCGVGICGACSVQLDGITMRSCVTPLAATQGKPLRTVEGLATVDGQGQVVLHPIQEAFIKHQVPQCAWCMSGQMMTALSFLENNSTPSEEEIIEAMGNNYCRCGCYVRIKAAVAEAATLMEASL
ncbi:MAG: (2Fe-2S)-binding protein [Deinococcales bacterium]